MSSVDTPSRSSSAVVRYQRSATCSSLDGSHSRPITKMAITSDHETVSRFEANSTPDTSSSFNARHKNHPSHTAPKLRERSSRTRSSLTATEPLGSLRSKSCPCQDSDLRPAILRASASARARPSASSSPSCATVCCTTLRPHLTERTNCQYTWLLPSLRRRVCRKYTHAHSHDTPIPDKILGRHYMRVLLSGWLKTPDRLTAVSDFTTSYC